MKKYALIILLVLNLSCNSDDNGDIVCTQVYVYGLSVTLKNAQTNEPITEGITVIAKDGSYEEQLVLFEGGNNFIGAGERAGTYTIEITSVDYQDIATDPVEVAEDECHVVPKSIEIFLQPI